MGVPLKRGFALESSSGSLSRESFGEFIRKGGRRRGREEGEEEEGRNPVEETACSRFWPQARRARG